MYNGWNESDAIVYITHNTRNSRVQYCTIPVQSFRLTWKHFAIYKMCFTNSQLGDEVNNLLRLTIETTIKVEYTQAHVDQ